MPLKAVFFDMDDTLVLTSEADKKACASVIKLAIELLPQVETKRLLEDWQSRFVAAPWDPSLKVPVAEWRTRHWAEALEDQGLHRSDAAAALQECFDKRRIELFRFEPGVKEMIRELRLAGKKVVIITNGHAQIQRTKLVACGAADLFDGILVGGEEVLAGRLEKPHPGIFLAACKLACCEPQEACHIGDNLATDVVGGINSGLKATIWVNRKGVPLPSASLAPTYIVEHVTQLAELLPEIETL